MKKIFTILLVMALALSLCACPALEQEATSGKRCNAGSTMDIPATGHIWSAWIKETACAVDEVGDSSARSQCHNILHSVRNG